MALLGLIIYTGLIYMIYVRREDSQIKSTIILIRSYGLLGVFLLMLVSGTIIPLGSPALVAIGAGSGIPVIPLATISAMGYTFGVVIDYIIGYLGKPLAKRRLKGEMLSDLTLWWKRYGWTICIVFGLVPGLPIDLLAILCGFLKMSLRTLVFISFCTLFLQFTLFAYFGNYIGVLLGIL
jgi:membrane protein YqaA with SNARE-associated domain